MKVIIATAPTIEPITLAEAKKHLYEDSETFDGNLTITQSLAHGSHIIADNYTVHVGTGFDVLGYEAIVQLSAGTNGATGTNETRIEESDQLAIGYTAWTGGLFTTVTTANDNADYKIQYTGTKQYIRTASKVLLAACEFSTSIIVNESTTAQDDALGDDIQAAREHVEDVTRRALLTQTWDYYLDAFPAYNSIKIPFGSLASVTHIKYTNSLGTETTMTVTTDYIVETNGTQCGRIVLPYGKSWPSFTAYTSKPIVIRFICGWTTAALLPRRIKSAVKMYLTDLWENRESQIFSTTMQPYAQNESVDAYLAPLRLWDEF